MGACLAGPPRRARQSPLAGCLAAPSPPPDRPARLTRFATTLASTWFSSARPALRSQPMPQAPSTCCWACAQRLRTDADRLSAEILLGSSFSELREYETADAHFERARLLLDRRSLTQVASLAAARSRRYIHELRIGDAWRCYEATLVDRRIDGRIRSEHLKGEIHHAEARNSEQAASLIRLLALIGETSMPTSRFGTVRSPISASSRVKSRHPPLPQRSPRRWQRARSGRPDFSTEHFYALRALAWCRALSGDALGAFRYLREAGTLAESLVNAPMRAMVLLDRAQLARNAREEHWCANELAAAMDVLRDVDWPHTSAV